MKYKATRYKLKELFKFKDHQKVKLVIGLIGVVWLIVLTMSIFNDHFEDKWVNLIQKLSPLLFSTVSLVIALLLFDRYGVRKIIFEKKVKAVLEVLEEINKIDITVYAYTQGRIQLAGFKLLLRKHMPEEYKTYNYHLDKPVVFNSSQLKSLCYIFEKHKNNVYLPQEIADKIFLVTYVGSFEPKLKDYVEFDLQLMTNDKYLVAPDFPFNTLGEFLIKFQVLLVAIEKWLKEYADIELRY